MTEHPQQKPPHLDRLSSVWRRFYDRKIAQWSVAYVALAYAIQHGVVLTEEAYEWPHAVQQISMLLLMLGLPVVMTFAWYHGERASRHISGPELTIIAILLAIGSLFFYVLVHPAQEIAAAPPTGKPPGAISVAVLPFVNLSSDKEQEFFSDGMTEEITSALAKIQNLRVVGRTSAFEFKGQNRDMRAIGQALSATHLIEGSVRKDGNEVRITAQLVRVDDGTHLWTENYDRELTGVFAVQEEIAQAIAASLQVPLGLQQRDTLVRSRTKDPEAYEQYLRARALLRAPTFATVTEATKLLEQVVVREPDFAPAWAQLSLAYEFVPTFHPAVFSAANEQARAIIELYAPKAEAAAERAVRVDAKGADGYVHLAFVQAVRGKYLAAGDLCARAFALDADNPDGLNLCGSTLADLGYIKQALPMRRRLLSVEPFVPLFTRISASIMAIDGQTDEAITLLKRVPEGFAAIRLAQIYGAQGRYGEAADLLLSRSDTYLPGVAETAARLLRTAPAAAASPETLPRLGSYLDFVYLAVGAPSRVLDYYEDRLKLSFVVPTNALLLWASPYANIRKTERFKAFVRNAGMVEYWRAKGWPDLCHPTTGDDFACN